MAVSLNEVNSNSASGSQSGLSWTHDTSSSANLLVVLLSIRGDGTAPNPSVTYNGVSMTEHASAISTGNYNYVYIFYLKNPSIGVNTVSVSLGNNSARGIGGVSMDFLGANGALGTANSDTGQNSVSVDVDSTSDDMVVDVVSATGTAGTWTVGAGQTKRAEIEVQSGDHEMASSTEGGSSSVTMSWDYSIGEYLVLLAASVRASVYQPRPGATNFQDPAII